MTGLIAIAMLVTAVAPPAAIAIRRLRRRLLTQALTERVGIELLPANTFDPGPEDIRRHAAALARVRPASGGTLTPQAARAVFIRLTSQDGKLHYELWGPRPATAVLRGRTYNAVELKLLHPEPEQTTAEPADAPDIVEAWPAEGSAIPRLIDRISRLAPRPAAADPLAQTMVFDQRDIADQL